jgi:hypothetical protein
MDQRLVSSLLRPISYFINAVRMVCSAMIDRSVGLHNLFGFTDWGDLLGFSYIATGRLKQKL